MTSPSAFAPPGSRSASVFRSPRQSPAPRRIRRLALTSTNPLPIIRATTYTTVLPYAEHFNLSIQRELTKATVLTVAYVGTEGHHLITQNEANPGNPTLCQQLTAQGAYDVTSQVAGCQPNNENDVFQLPTATVPCTTASPTPLPGCVYGTRSGLLTPNYCPESATLVCYGSNNTNTLTRPIPSTTPAKSAWSTGPTIFHSSSPILSPKHWMTLPPSAT